MEILMKDIPFGQVVSVTGMSVTIEIYKQVFQNNLELSKVIAPGNNITLPVGIVGDIFLIGGPSTSQSINYAIFEEIKLLSVVGDSHAYIDDVDKSKAVVIAKVIGYQDLNSKDVLHFRRGVGHYPKFNSKCYLLSSDEKKQLFALNLNDGINIGKMSSFQNEEVSIHINKLLGKHSVILGSTGSGKSCTVASIMQSILKSHKFSHVVFFDPHDEYSSAFPNKRGSYRVNKIKSQNLHLPYWMLNYDEFQNIFLGEIDPFKNSNGIRILKEEIIRLKHSEHIKVLDEIGEINKISINAPLFYSFENELLPKLKKLNKRTIWKSDGQPALTESGEYLPSSGNRNITRGDGNDNVLQDTNYYGELDHVIEKLESINSDRRYEFLFSSIYTESTTFYRYISELLSIPLDGKQNQITIIDLSNLPSEVVPLLIGITSRLCFEYKLWEKDPHKLPIYLVLEEAHNYIPRETTSITKLTKKYLGRIAKEGRKYGVSQMIVSQRPSDLDETIVSQCSNFFIHRVTNPNDQSFIKHVMPDHLSALSEMIPYFQNGECLIAGECVTIPTKVLINQPSPEPNSKDVQYSKTWKKIIENYDAKTSVHRWWDVIED